MDQLRLPEQTLTPATTIEQLFRRPLEVGYSQSQRLAGHPPRLPLVYGNTNRGILVENSSASGHVEVFKNTVYQVVGDAVRLDNSARNVKLYNNILWVQSGYDIFVATNSQTGFASNYNLLHKGSDINASRHRRGLCNERSWND